MSKDFYEEQSDITAAKIQIYKEYITGYLPKILNTYDKCLIADLFCGPGKHGNKDGSPLVLIRQAEYILTSPVLKRKNLNIDILFNDVDKNNIDNLNLSLKNFTHQNINMHPPKNNNFQDILIEILETMTTSQFPKFFFLDPFTYSDVTMDNLQSLMALDNTEVFLFIPIFHAYRFANNTNYSKEHKTRIFIEQFTIKGMADYDDIDDYMQSIKGKLREQLNLDYVRPILLDDGKRKNAVFLLTKHKAGMLLMNKVALKKSDDGGGVNIKQQKSGQGALFGTQGTSRFDIFSKKIKRELRDKKTMTNDSIIDFTIREEFLPKHAKDVLKAMASENKITVYEGGNDITQKQGEWNIAEKTTKKITFTYDN